MLCWCCCNLKSAYAQAMDVDAQQGAGAAPADLGGGAMVVIDGPDITRLHGQPLDWLLKIKPNKFTAVPPLGHTFQPLVSVPSACSRHHAALQKRYPLPDALPKNYFDRKYYDELSRKDQAFSRKLSEKVGCALFSTAHCRLPIRITANSRGMTVLVYLPHPSAAVTVGAVKHYA